MNSATNGLPTLAYNNAQASLSLRVIDGEFVVSGYYRNARGAVDYDRQICERRFFSAASALAAFKAERAKLETAEAFGSLELGAVLLGATAI